MVMFDGSFFQLFLSLLKVGVDVLSGAEKLLGG